MHYIIHQNRNRGRMVSGGVMLLWAGALLLGGGAVNAQTGRLQGDWWDGPAVPGRHTTFVATYNGTSGSDADHARGNPLSGGFGMEVGVPGRHGRAVRITQVGGHLHYHGENHVNPHRGTVRLFVRGDLWRDETPRWLFEARGDYRIGIRRESTVLSLVFSVGTNITTPLAQLDLPVREVSTDAWHVVVASWDRAAGTGAIALDGEVVTGPMKFPPPRSPMFIFYVGGGFGGRLGGLNEAGMDFDEVTIWDQPLAALEAPAPPLAGDAEALLSRVEVGARKYLNFFADLQHGGGWAAGFSWPTLIGAGYQGREGATPPDIVSFDYGGHAVRVAQYLYAWEILGDDRLLEVALRAGDLMVAAQDPVGFWVSSYSITPRGVRPHGGLKFKDNVQSYPLYALAYLHRLVGGEEYLAALRRGGEFYLRAQNPNGSWSNHWDRKTGMGMTHRGTPQGGEMNDQTMNNGIDVMTLMAHVTGDRRYVDAAKRAGQWLIDAQLTGATRGWAQQYDKDNRPDQARHFEVPACARSATLDAVRALVEVYRLSGDERFLRPVRECLAWAERSFPNGRMSFYHDPADNRPIAQYQYKIYHLDVPEEAAAIRALPGGVWYYRDGPITEPLRQLLESAAAPVNRNPDLTRETALVRLADVRAGAEEALTTQDPSGVWVTPIIADFMGSRGASLSGEGVRPLLRYAETARTAKGELAPAGRGDGDLLTLAFPGADWYDIGW